MARYNSEYFKKKFDGLPPKAMAIIALRAAVRVFPLLAQRTSREAFWFWPAGDRAHHTIAVCRCFQTSAFANSLHAAAAYFASAASAASASASASDSAIFAANAARAAAAASASASDSARAAAAADATALATAAADALVSSSSAVAAILTDIAQIKRRSWIDRLLREDVERDPVFLLGQPLWLEDVPAEAAQLWIQLQKDLRSLDAGFQVWIDWYQDRLDGKPFDWEIERQWALLSKEQLSQSPAEINAYLKGLRDGALTKELKRVRAIFIGHGEVGKTSLIRATERDTR
jgi:hypothetical protein